MPAGRPTKFKPEYNEQVEKLCLLGATDEQLANFFNVTEQTINNWKSDFPEFFESIKRGKQQADNQVAESLYHRALGYSHEDTKAQWVYDSKTGGRWEYAEMIKHYPPDTAAAFIWLKNRQGWKDKQEIEHSGEVKTSPIQSELEKLKTDDLLNIANELSKPKKVAQSHKKDKRIPKA